MKIYTRTGDAGETGLIGGGRVPKDDERIDAYGQVDELNASLGVARAAILPPDIDREIAAVQHDLFVLGADLADPRPTGPGQMRLDPAAAARLEPWIDAMETTLTPLRNFILPGGSPGGAALHYARTVCRRAERGVVALARNEPRAGAAVVYLNRLADALFVAARAANRGGGATEVEWKPRG